MIGIIGYGMVGKAVEYGFPDVPKIISDPLYGNTDLVDVVRANPQAIFVCVPTPTDGTDYAELRGVLKDIINLDYQGLIIVKSTVLPQYLEEFDVVYNPEFLSRATANNDFVNPPLLVLGGKRAQEALVFYQTHSIVKPKKVFITSIETASLAKYTMNSFYAMKVTYMNSIYDIADQVGADYGQLTEILKSQPWMGSHHFDVPGPDGRRGFGGPCLPKDAELFANKFDLKLLSTALDLNADYRK